MVLDFVAALCYIIIVWGLGQWMVAKLFRDDQERGACLLSFALGFSELTLLSTFLYFTCRMPAQAIRVVWIVLFCGVLADLTRGHRFHKGVWAVLGGVFFLWLVMLLPGLIGGDQYYVYRGNCTDQQTYVEEAVALSMHSIGWYESRTEEEIQLVSDVLWRGYQWSVNDRPSAGLMIAMMRANPSGEIYWVVYLYRMFVLAIVMMSMLYLFAFLLRGQKEGELWQKVIWALAAALYCVGFWGQIQYDIDAVSQVSSIAVLTALTAVFLQYAQELVEGQNETWNARQYLMMLLLATAGLALYLESALVHGALYLAVGFLLLWSVKGKRLTWKQIVRLLGIPVLSLGALLLSNYRIIYFLVGQIHTSVSDGRQSWANYFNAWWAGRYGIDGGRITGPVSWLANRVMSIFGLYNMTPNYERYYGVTALILTGLSVITAVCIVFCILRPLVKKMDRPVWMLWTVAAMGIVIVLGMCACGKVWSAGKLLYYISPYLYTFLCIPVLQIKNCSGIAEKAALVLAVLLLVSNAKMVLQRCYDTKVNWACLGYRGNYPSDMIPGLKMNADFDFDTGQLEGVNGVRIRDLSTVSDHQFYLQYLKVKLTCAQISWIPENDINYYQSPVEISQHRELTGPRAILEAVQDERGRYRIVVTKEK